MVHHVEICDFHKITKLFKKQENSYDYIKPISSIISKELMAEIVEDNASYFFDNYEFSDEFVEFLQSLSRPMTKGEDFDFSYEIVFKESRYHVMSFTNQSANINVKFMFARKEDALVFKMRFY